MCYEKKKVLVVGMARSGVAAAKKQRASGAEAASVLFTHALFPPLV